MKLRTSLLLMLVLACAEAYAQIPGGAFTNATPQPGCRAGPLVIGADGLGLYVGRCDQNHFRISRCSNPACSATTTQTLAAPGAGFASIALGSDGLPLISYHDLTEFRLHVAHCSDPSCAAATVNTLAAEVVGFWSNAIALGSDGLALISYQAADSLRVAHCDDTLCSTASFATIDSGIDGDVTTSIAIGTDGRALIAYNRRSGFTGIPMVAHCKDAACSSATVTALDAVGRDASITIGADGLGLVAYWDHLNWGLKVAHCENVACTTASVSVVDSGSVGGGAKIRIGPDGLGLIAYSDDFSAFMVKVAHCNDVPCSSAKTVRLGRGNGGPTGLVFGADGLPLITYTGGGTEVANVAHQSPRGDLNLDGRLDLAWRRLGTGDNMVWLMNGIDLVTAPFTNPSALADTRWRIVGTNDFNHDAQTDLLWRHSSSGQNVVWLMNGVNLVSGTFTTPLADTRWQMVGTDDFDRDGRPDILWRHDVSGENVLWYMNGTALASGTFLTPATLADTLWKMAGTGDFNRDGKPDILWHHSFSGQAVIWYMNGSVMASGTFTDPPGLADVNWRIAAVGDYNVDASPDIVWHHQGSGQVVVWFMNDETLMNGAFTNPSTFPDTNWKLVGPR
jgi:hypothetical protein